MDHKRMLADTVRFFSFCLVVCVLLSACSGGGDDPAVTTEDTTAADVTGDDSGTANVTTAGGTQTEYPTGTPDTLRILSEQGRTEDIVGGENTAVLAARQNEMKELYALTLENPTCDNITSKVYIDHLSGNMDYDLLLLDSVAGAKLLCSGLLENLSGAGIDIDPARPGVNPTLTEDLSFNGGCYLIVSDALVSDICASSALFYDGSLDSSVENSLISGALSGTFTVEMLVSVMQDIKDKEDIDIPALALGNSFARLSLFHGMGGDLLVLSADGLPSSAVRSGTFNSSYSSALDLISGADTANDKTAVFTVTLLSQTPSEGQVYLPIPKPGEAEDHMTAVDPDKLSFLAAPEGVSDGSRLSYLFDKLNECSSGLRAESLASVIAGERDTESRAQAEELLALIIANTHLDQASLFKWGDLDRFVSDGLENGISADELLKDSTLKSRNETVDTAASIVAGRLN